MKKQDTIKALRQGTRTDLRDLRDNGCSSMIDDKREAWSVPHSTFREACERIADMLEGDDGEAWFEAEKFLKRYAPDLYNEIGMQHRPPARLPRTDRLRTVARLGLGRYCGACYAGSRAHDNQTPNCNVVLLGRCDLPSGERMD